MSEIRYSCVAGAFYPESRVECTAELEEYTRGGGLSENITPVAGIAPHAGWVYSGATAGKVFSYFKEHSAPDTFVIFGASHRYVGSQAVMLDKGRWETPLGMVDIDEEFAGKLLGGSDGLVAGAAPHAGEHSIEVQVPFIKYLFPEARIVPIIVPAGPDAGILGASIGKIMNEVGNVVALGSTDLTHYGFEYGFAPKGVGEEALKWVREVNDRRMIDLAANMRAGEIVEEARTYHNACGAGAVSATIAAAAACGAKKGYLVEYTTSHDVIPRGRPSMFVGYAGMVFG
ncbi:MAG TPA: AmmeMemoRadiSam system protein B [bacterium]|nr:AmmeMemoRadiSam system protein B [bacterium]